MGLRRPKDVILLKRLINELAEGLELVSKTEFHLTKTRRSLSEKTKESNALALQLEQLSNENAAYKEENSNLQILSREKAFAMQQKTSLEQRARKARQELRKLREAVKKGAVQAGGGGAGVQVDFLKFLLCNGSDNVRVFLDGLSPKEESACIKVTSVDEAMQQIIADVCNVLQCDRASFWIVDNAKREMWTRKATGAEMSQGAFTEEDEFLMANFGSNAATVIEKCTKNESFQWFISRKDMLIDDFAEYGSTYDHQNAFHKQIVMQLVKLMASCLERTVYQSKDWATFLELSDEGDAGAHPQAAAAGPAAAQESRPATATDVEKTDEWTDAEAEGGEGRDGRGQDLDPQGETGGGETHTNQEDTLTEGENVIHAGSVVLQSDERMQSTDAL
uniref:Uncharacterized protein n=1 Tax=Chromera velia CCMP2878 TaxID=1169474 RepID=A0A0G4G2J0_9ALVE|eukprot:Cvel_19928.t1-p1 / transcript=Cvel_19928.t1 / gene=Cvel_19928 / organism=Chromera_velia_CCMP2878 / gene_product=hypothetical protein / transcript_product=hypothetical protein / location=Cvel_scaffold1753:19703-29230(+) / protein_length=391 / sequence_SO=supercontig / SO=protein_coding / is_pseudo=false